MTREEAWKIIEECRGWNTSQKSSSWVCRGERSAEDDVLDAKRASLAKAWKVVGEDD